MASNSTNEALAALREQGESLHRIVSLIEDRVDWEAWPEADRETFATALCPEGVTAFEVMKARSLARHLFRAEAPDLRHAAVPDPVGLADRIRADLSGLVPLGAGRFLLEQFPPRPPSGLSRP